VNSLLVSVQKEAQVKCQVSDQRPDPQTVASQRGKDGDALAYEQFVGPGKRAAGLASSPWRRLVCSTFSAFRRTTPSNDVSPGLIGEAAKYS
jgi:hypothetical protein